MNRPSGWLIGAVALLVPLLLGCGSGESLFNGEPESDERPVVRYGHVPSQSTAETLDRLGPLRDRLEEELSVRFRISFATSYGELVRELREGEFDFVTLGPLSYVEAADTEVARVAFKPTRQGSEDYRSIIFTHENSDVESLSDLEDRSFAFVDRGSASGYLFPRAFLTEQLDRSFEEVIGRYDFLGDHDNVVLNVWLQNYAAGAVYEDAREDADNADRILDETTVLARTPSIPNEPWAFHPQFRQERPELVEEIKSIMLGLQPQDPEDRPILDSLEVDGFVEATDDEYDIVRDYRALLPGDDIEESN